MPLLFVQPVDTLRPISTCLQAIRISILLNGSWHPVQAHPPMPVSIIDTIASGPFHTTVLMLHSMQALCCVHIGSMIEACFAKQYNLSIVLPAKNALHNCCPIRRCCFHWASN